MQLSISFNYPETPKREKILEKHILKEFQQGNFSKALETRLTSEEITDILLQRHDTPKSLKTNILKHMIKKCNNEGANNNFPKNEEEITQKIREHNDEVRERLRQAFNAKDPEILKKI
ncbi:MAG: hypothetical protein LBI53_05225 [Candidatus Peribacteria bacterium]|jgi:uncharacterized alpha-E superfamily protein|nr:hypothetical protein [Candidatus Peribacteria bacterium]